MRILILGIGNTLLSDEGVGVSAMRMLADQLGSDPGLEFVDGGTLSFTLAVPISACDGLIVLDAAMIDGPAGSVALFEDEAMDEFLGANRKASVHEVSLLDLMAIAHLTETLPSHRALIGVRPQKVDWGENLTPPVAAALVPLCEVTRKLIARWRAAG